MKNILATVCILVLAATVSNAQESMSGAGFEINPVSDVVYEAVSTGDHGGAAFWCAAGMFVRTVLKKPAKTEIYVVRGAGPSVTTGRRSAAQFTLDPVKAGVTPAESSDNLNDPVVGEHMEAGRTHLFCSDG